MSDQVKHTQKLKDKKVLVIGGSAGIGYGVAEASLEHGATVIISSSNPDRVAKAVKNLQSAYPSASSRISGHACNLADEATLESNIKNLFDQAGKNIDHVVYTAGDKLAQMSLGTVDMAKIKQAGMVRFFGPMLVGKIAPGYMNKGPESSIVLTTGAVSERPIPDWTVVGSYATGLHGMTRQLALDLKPLRVNLVSPGAVHTDLWQDMSEEQRQGLFKTFSSRMTTGVVGQVVDVAESYLYLMRDQNISGAIISTSGGHLLM